MRSPTNAPAAAAPTTRPSTRFDSAAVRTPARMTADSLGSTGMIASPRRWRTARRRRAAPRSAGRRPNRTCSKGGTRWRRLVRAGAASEGGIGESRRLRRPMRRPALVSIGRARISAVASAPASSPQTNGASPSPTRGATSHAPSPPSSTSSRARRNWSAAAPTLIVVGAGDDAEVIVASAEALTAALATAGVEAALVRIPDMAHALADEPGLEPAPQTLPRPPSTRRLPTG